MRKANPYTSLRSKKLEGRGVHHTVAMMDVYKDLRRTLGPVEAGYSHFIHTVVLLCWVGTSLYSVGEQVVH